MASVLGTVRLESILISKPDTFSTPQLLNPTTSNPEGSYVFSDKGIAWPGESKKYIDNPIGKGHDNLDQIVPPPNWALRYPGNVYTEQNPPPNLAEDEHFQNWMRTAGLPTFTKLYGRNDSTTMASGTYQIIIGMSMLCSRLPRSLYSPASPSFFRFPCSSL